MKEVSNFLSVAALVLLFGYILYNETGNRTQTFRRTGDAISDEAVAPESYASESLEPPFATISFDLPEQASFAGEPVPLHIADVKERLDRELQMNVYLHSNTLFLIKRAKRWLPQIEKILEANDIPEDFKYLPLIESNLLNVVSPKEAAGFWQILKTSGTELGLEINDEVDERYDPIKATYTACKYLRKAYDKFGNWTLVAASYNRGMAGIQRAVNDQQVDSYYDLYLNEETSRYVFRLLAMKEIINNPSRYGFKVNLRHLYDREEVVTVEVSETIPDLVSFAKKHNSNYKLLKRHNPWLRDTRLTVRKGKRYKIAFPVNKEN